MTLLVHFLLGSKADGYFPSQNKAVYEKRLAEVMDSSFSGLFTVGRSRNVTLKSHSGQGTMVARTMETLFTVAGSVPTYYNKHCWEQLFQLSTCAACSLEGRPSTKPEAD